MSKYAKAMICSSSYEFPRASRPHLFHQLAIPLAARLLSRRLRQSYKVRQGTGVNSTSAPRSRTRKGSVHYVLSDNCFLFPLIFNYPPSCTTTPRYLLKHTAYFETTAKEVLPSVAVCTRMDTGCINYSIIYIAALFRFALKLREPALIHPKPHDQPNREYASE
ncbi:hypothetical protein NEOLEDRAFT_562601 [Neolentinus lepideus HHB14362 ss-1]|uniref:Uncharacterized protein n=1 Tax=Neolentinus lepideus HHB14362 ss-1 TaxID=1314782 RepID=A0A165R265_9AGAM|nr:hypothetical protein NEOLEDRAFT_562601 [Neolentinus lepideus HHB14362 ss-1]